MMFTDKFYNFDAVDFTKLHKSFRIIKRKKKRYVLSKVIFEDPVGLDWGRKIFSHHVSTLEGLELTKGRSLNK